MSWISAEVFFFKESSSFPKDVNISGCMVSSRNASSGQSYCK